MVPFRNTSLGARYSMSEVACFHPDLLGGSFPVTNSGQPYRVFPRLVPICRVLSPSLQGSLFKGQGLQC